MTSLLKSMFHLKVKSTVDPLEFTLMMLVHGLHMSAGLAFLKLVKCSQMLISPDTAFWTRLSMFNALISSKHLIFKVLVL